MSRMLLGRSAAADAVRDALSRGPVVVHAPAGRGKTALLQALAEDAVAVVDDLQRLPDEALAPLVERAERGEPVLAATRPVPVGSQPLLERLLGAATVVELPPLTVDEVGEPVHVLTGGNAWLVEHHASGGAPRRLVARVACAGEPAVRFARALAVLGEDATVARAGRVAGLQVTEAAEAATALVHWDLLPATGLPPMVAGALVDDLADHERRLLRAVAARVLDADGTDPGRVAAQLLDAEPSGDSRAVAALERAAAHARSAGAPADAARALERALVEPPEPGARLRIRLALAETRTTLGDPAAEAEFEAALDLAATEAERVQVLLALAHARVLGGRFEAATEAAASAEALMNGGTPPEMERAVRATAALARSFTGPAVSGAELEELFTPQTTQERAQLAHSLVTASILGLIDADRARRLAGRALDGGHLVGADPGVISMVTGVLYFTGELDSSIALSTAAIEAPGRTALDIAVLSYLRSAPMYMRGRLEEAEADAARAAEGLDPASGWAFGAWSMLAAARLERLGPEPAMAVLAGAPLADPPPGIVAQVWHATRARVLLGAARPAEALEAALEAGRNVLPGTEPYGHVFDDWRGCAVMAHLALGEREAAAGLASEALELQTRWGAAPALVRPLIALGLATGDDTYLDRAVHTAADTQHPGLRIEAFAHRGAAARRAGRGPRARGDLYAAAELARTHGFGRLAGWIGDELDAAGARRRSAARSGRAALTAGEERVVRLAARGVPNRAIAAELFLSPKTVEFHLANAYRKLGVRNRTELGERLRK